MPKFSTVLGVSALVFAGFVAGFILSKRYENEFEVDFDEPAEPEQEVQNITVTPEDVNPPYVSKYYDNPEEAVAALIPGFNPARPSREDKQYRRVVYQYQSPEPAVKAQTMYEELLGERELDPDFSQDASPNPRVISVRDFFDKYTERDKITVTWYAGDGVCADQDDTVVEDMDTVIGVHNLKFGQDSGDPNVVYVRNDVLGLDYEIVRSEGSYKTDVLGLD